MIYTARRICYSGYSGSKTENIGLSKPLDLHTWAWNHGFPETGAY